MLSLIILAVILGGLLASTSFGLCILILKLVDKPKLNLRFKTTRWSETANGSLVLRQEGTERATHAAKKQK
jgi:hypothetical protein